MAQSSAEQVTWVKSVLGLDLDALLSAQDAAKEPGAPVTEDEIKRSSFTKFKQKVAETVGLRAPPPTDKDLLAAIDQLDDTIDEVKDLGCDVARLGVDRDDCARAAVAAEKLPAGDARDKAVAAAKKRIADLEAHALALKKAFADVMGKKTSAPSAAEKSQIYQKALETHYGIKIENPSGLANTHLDRVFDMFGAVPIGDANQEKLKTLKYFTEASWKGSGAYNKSELTVKMGDFGKAEGEEDYEIDGTVIPANSFDVTTLHEIGHSVDALHTIMDSHGAASGCGGWNTESVDSITAIYLADLKSTAGLSDKAKDPDLEAAIKKALDKGDTTKPDEIEQPDWEKVVDYLTKKCIPIRADKKPWYVDPGVVVGPRVYQQAYPWLWVSYEQAARGKTKVNGYQWRAPGEWFAEVYAISWLKKKKPPAGVDGSVLPYMWNG